MSPNNRGQQIAPAYASITSVIEADQMAAYSQAPAFDSSAVTTLYREQPVLYAGEVYQQGVAAPEQLHFSQTYTQYPLYASAPQLSPRLDAASPTSGGYFSDGSHDTSAFGGVPPYASSDASNLDDILEDGEFGAAGASSSGGAAGSATEEEKRRRNQAASARFRQKKKAREAQMERSLKDLAQKKDELELRCAKLEVENRFLKDLLTEKDSHRRERGPVVPLGAARGKGKARARGLDIGDDEMKEVDDRKDGVGTDL